MLDIPRMPRLLRYGLVILALAACGDDDSSTSSGPDAAPEGAGPGSAEEMAREAFRLINQYRAENGIPTLAWNDTLAEFARSHSRDVAAGTVDMFYGLEDRRTDVLEMMDVSLYTEKGCSILESEDGSTDEEIAERASSWLDPGFEQIQGTHVPRPGDFALSGIGAAGREEGGRTRYFFVQGYAGPE